jgi:hypothetical protein
MQHRSTAVLLALALAGLSTSCFSFGDPLARGEALEETQRRYTEMIRWGDIDKAARYVDPEQREGFLALAQNFELIRITDYEIGELDIDPDTLARAEVDVTYHGYVLNEFVERRVNDHQVWVREAGNDWRVRPELDALIDSLGVRRR